MSEVNYWNMDVDSFGSASPYRSEHGRWVQRKDYDALTAEFSDLAERYAKLQTGEDGVVARVVAERDAALAELAALKGGQVAVAWRVTGAGGLTVTPQYPSWAEDDTRLSIEPLYLAPPAQAIAWPEGWKLVPIEITHEMIDAANSARGWVESDSLSRGCYRAMLAAAPNHGASDGKGGEHE